MAGIGSHNAEGEAGIQISQIKYLKNIIEQNHRACESAVVVASAPERPINGDMANETLSVHLTVREFGDLRPLSGQSQMLERQAVMLNHSILGDWIGRAS